MARQNYQRLSPADIDEIWSRMRAGHAVKPTARSLGLATGTVRTYLLRCAPAHRHFGSATSRTREADATTDLAQRRPPRLERSHRLLDNRGEPV